MSKILVHVMADGMPLTEAEIIKQLRSALKSSTKTWNGTSIKSVVRIMSVLDVSRKTKRLAEDCLAKFLSENSPSGLIPKGTDFRKLIRRAPKDFLGTLLDRISGPVMKAAERLEQKHPGGPTTAERVAEAFNMGRTIARKALLEDARQTRKDRIVPEMLVHKMWAVVDADGKLLCKFEGGKYVGESVFVTRAEAETFKGTSKSWRVARIRITEAERKAATRKRREPVREPLCGRGRPRGCGSLE
jgi:hypothetical protein